MHHNSAEFRAWRRALGQAALREPGLTLQPSEDSLALLQRGGHLEQKDRLQDTSVRKLESPGGLSGFQSSEL